MGDGFEAGQCGGVGNFPFQAGDRPVGDAAWVDEGEVAEIGGDVEGETVGGDAARDVNADGADFAASGRGRFEHSRPGMRPKAVAARPHQTPVSPAMRPAGTPIYAAEADQCFFHAADEIYRAEAAAGWVVQAAQIEDGVADQLAGPVVGDVAAAIDLVDCDAAPGQQLIGGQNVGAVRRCGPG